MKGKIATYLTDRGIGWFKEEGHKRQVFFHISQVPNHQRDFVAVGLEAEFDIGPGKQGKEQAINIRLVLDEDVSGDYACIVVDEAGDWRTTDSREDRAIVLSFFPSDTTLTDLATGQAGLLSAFHASEAAGKRTELFDKMGMLVQALSSDKRASFAVGRIPGMLWPQVETLGTSLWAAMIARLVAVYLPFVKGRAWVAIEDRIVTPELWSFYRHELRGRFADACFMLKRPDLAQVDTWLRLCIYAKRQGVVTHHEGTIAKREGAGFAYNYLWDPDARDKAPIPIDHIRSGISLPDFIGNVMVSGHSKAADKWREQLRPHVREVDLTSFRL